MKECHTHVCMGGTFGILDQEMDDMDKWSYMEGLDWKYVWNKHKKNRPTRRILLD